MLVGIYKLNKPDFLKKSNDIYKKILEYNNIAYVEISLEQPDFWEKVKTLDLFIFRWAQPDNHHQIAKTILPIIENHYNILCFPNLKTCWHYDDKIKEYLLFKSKGYPFIKSWIFYEKQSALEWSANADFPVVFKLKNGAGSSNVILIRNEIEAVKMINRMFGKGLSANGIPQKEDFKNKDFEKYIRRKIDKYFLNKIKGIEPQMWQIAKNYVLFQKFLPNNSFDTRITTIGDRVFASRRFVSKSDFRASGNGKYDINHEKIDKRMLKIARRISDEMKFQTMAYDFLINKEGEPEICEISYTYSDNSINFCHGYWDKNLIWCEGKYYPEFFHIKDALKIDDLQQHKII